MERSRRPQHRNTSFYTSRCYSYILDYIPFVIIMPNNSQPFQYIIPFSPQPNKRLHPTLNQKKSMCICVRLFYKSVIILYNILLIEE